MIKRNVICGIAGCIFGSQAYCQQYLSISVTDSKSPTVISNAVVEELVSGQTIVTDINGEGEFPNPVQGGTAHFRVSAPGFPTRFYERFVPEVPSDFDYANHQVLELTQANEFTTPILGPAGGSKSTTLATGYLLYEPALSSEPTEYSQSISATLPPGALGGNYRIGFSMIPGAGQAENTMNVLQIGSGTNIVAQFELGWLDVSGTPAPAPTLTQPIRVEMAAASIFFADELPGSWQVSLYKFDEVSMTWNAAAAGTSGVNANGLLWADVLSPGYYSFMAYDQQLSLSTLCNREWKEEEWIGPAEDDSDVTCPNSVNIGGAQSEVDVTYGETEGTTLSGSVSVELSTKLKLLGLKSEISVKGEGAREDTWGTYKEKHYGWDTHAYAGEGQGKIYLHPKGWTMIHRKWCINAETGAIETDEILATEGPFKTGYTVRKDLTPCP